MSSAPVGIIDSGFGGLSIYESITSLLPHESTIYVGDHAHAPYGDKTSAYIQNRIKKLIHFFLKKKVKLVVIACNTATVSGIEQYRQWFPTLPIVGVVPVIKTAATVSQKKKFAVLSTDATAKSHYQQRLIQDFASGCFVYNLACPGLVQLVENGKTNGSLVQIELKKTLKQDILRNIDVIVLGCTHFPFLKSAIRDIVGNEISILDSGGAVARQVQRILEHNGLLVTEKKATHTFYSTRNTKEISSIASLLLQRPIKVTYATI